MKGDWLVDHLTESTGKQQDTVGETEMDASLGGIGKRILVVEDSEAAIIQITDFLINEGFSVDIARNGREALNQVALGVPDVMILDLMMPEVDGFEVIKMVRSIPETESLPVMILTAKHVTPEELSFLKGNNIFQLIQKGDISKDELIQVVLNMVHGKK
ncbi:MAG: response regulator [Bacteroidales bacterium]|nr:response regulator [Bacteroidales bacterium]